MSKPLWFDPTAQERLQIDQEFLQVEVTEVLHEAMAIRQASRADLARLSGITRSALSQRMSGRRSMTLKTLASMLHHLGFRLKVDLIDTRQEPRHPEPITRVMWWTAPTAVADDKRKEQVTSGAPKPW